MGTGEPWKLPKKKFPHVFKAITDWNKIETVNIYMVAFTQIRYEPLFNFSGRKPFKEC